MPFIRPRCRQLLVLSLAILTIVWFCTILKPSTLKPTEYLHLRKYMNLNPLASKYKKSSFDWGTLTPKYPPPKDKPFAWAAPVLPEQRSKALPTIQFAFDTPSADEELTRRQRRDAVRDVFARDWDFYRAKAWGKDALNPKSGTGKNQFSGWAATLVDSLDALWIMGLRDEFDEAVAAVARIDFARSTSNNVNTFETNIRYLGGLLSAYDLSERDVLLAKAVELGDMLYAAFNTPNRMPVDFIKFDMAKSGKGLVAEDWVVAASPGSLCLEMTHLSQVTGDLKYFEAVTAVMKVFQEQQGRTRLPGLWPMWVSMKSQDVSARAEFTLGGGADSLFEYLPKMIALLGGRRGDFGNSGEHGDGGDEERGTPAAAMYESMTRDFLYAANRHMFFRPMLPDEADILVSGNANVGDDGAISFDPESEHLTCFIGGAVALGGRILRQPDDVERGVKLAKGCGYAYHAFKSGMMPERYNMIPCEPKQAASCPWDEDRWDTEKKKRAEFKASLPKGFTTAKDPRYLLRPEAIESIFVTYRLTGDPELLETAWEMFTAITAASEVEFGHGAVKDVTLLPENLVTDDYMESFWLAETLKYFYLIFSPPDVISLDEFVLNTEAHPFRMPRDSEAPRQPERA